MTSLSAKTARALGFLEAGEEGRQLEMSGRRGIGVKADDLIDRLEAKSREEISKRNRELPPAELDLLARQIACAAVRYFMIKTTTTRVIAFDLEQALSFEGDSGPYLQYSLVRANNILRRLSEEGIDSRLTASAVAALPADGTRIVLDREGPPLLGSPITPPVTLAVGPEGGLESDELEALDQAGFHRGSFGGAVLRFETAAIAGLAIVRTTLAEAQAHA